VARKQKNSEGGISLDSLMDALTNVVAVLIMVVILVQADVSKKVQKFFDDLPPATPEQIAETKNLITEMQRKQRLAEERLMEKPATPEKVEAEMREITLLEKSLKENKELLADLDQVKSLEKKVRAVPTNYFLWLVIRLDMGSGGTPLDDIAKPDSEFIKSLHVIRQTYKSILLYKVATDSFRTYLAAREISERGNISAG
jgi:hypothetical protein